MKGCAFLSRSLIVATGLGLMVGGCPTEMPNDPNDGGGGGGDATAGRTLYEQSCAACHRLGSFDTTGSAPDLSGTGSLLVNDLGTIDSLMSGITLTDQEIADLAAFLDAN